MPDNRGISGRSVARVEGTNGAPPFLFAVQTEAATATYTLADSLGFRLRVIDAWCVATAAGAASDTVTVRNNTDAITDAMSLNVSDEVVVRAGSIDDGFHVIAPDGSLTVATASGAVALVYVLCARVDS